VKWLHLPSPVPGIQAEQERLRAKVAEVFDVPVVLLGKLYDGEFLPTGPVVESTAEGETK
jgi:hypothetical protein